MLDRCLATLPNATKHVVLLRAAKTVRFLLRSDADVGGRTALQICHLASTERCILWRHCFPFIVEGKFTDLLDILASPHCSVNGQATTQGRIVG